MTDISRRDINISELPEPILSTNAKYIAETRYSKKDEEGKSIETVKDIFWRVSTSVAKGDSVFGVNEEGIDNLAKTFYQLMAEQKFLPNTPCLVNAGKIGRASCRERV